MKTTFAPLGQPLIRLGKLFLATLLLAMGASVARASDPNGVYAFVDRVVFEPSAANPERIQVWGGFALAKGRGDEYSAAERGYLYFKLRPGEEEICKKEWADLKAVAGTSQIVSFGSRHDTGTTLRKPDAKVENPDVYPKGWGMNKVRPRNYPPLNQLVDLQSRKSKIESPPKPAPAK